MIDKEIAMNNSFDPRFGSTDNVSEQNNAKYTESEAGIEENQNSERRATDAQGTNGGFENKEYSYNANTGYQPNSQTYANPYTGSDNRYYAKNNPNPNQTYCYGGQYANGGSYTANSQPNYGPQYYGYGVPQTSYRSPYDYRNQRTKKPVTKGFVVAMILIGVAASIVINFYVSIFLGAIFDSDNSSKNSLGGKSNVIIEYAPKDENAPIITDKGITAYVASLVANTVVEVTTETVETDSYFGQYITQGAGSGVIVSSSEDGSYILTCAHVIEGAAKVTVKLKDGTVYTAESFICDTESDVGVIKLNVKGLPCATVGDFSKVMVGEEVVAIGNPLGTLGGSVTNGIVSALDRDIIIDGTTYHLLQTNAEINPGNSGGGLFNAEGQLIGIVNAKSTGENVEGLGFAIPISDAVAIMTDLLEKGYVAGRVKLGFQLIELITPEQAQSFFSTKEGIKYYRYFTDYGVYIITSEDPSFNEGDLLVAINDERVTCFADIKALLQKFKVGQEVTVTVSRIVGNKVQMFDYKLTLTEKKA